MGDFLTRSGFVTGLEFSTFPTRALKVGVDFSGFSYPENGSFIWARARGQTIFSRGDTWWNHNEHGDAILIDASLVLVAEPLRIMAIQVQRDIKLGIGLNIALRAVGYEWYQIFELNSLGTDWTCYYYLQGDAAGLRIVHENEITESLGLEQVSPGQRFFGADFGAVQIVAGLNWEVAHNMSLGLSIHTQADLALLVGPEKVHLLTLPLAFGRLEYILDQYTQYWSVYLDAGMRSAFSSLSTPRHEAHKPYPFAQFGLKVAFR